LYLIFNGLLTAVLAGEAPWVTRTGLPFAQIAAPLAAARDRGLLVIEAGAVRPTELGWRFLNDLIQHFGPTDP